MHISLTTTLPLLSALLTLTTAKQSTDANGCSTFEPTSAYQIYSSLPDLSIDLTIPNYNSNLTNSTTNSTRLSRRSAAKDHPRPRRSAHIPFTFYVSQDADNTNAQDLIVGFANLPCSGPGPFSFEFNFVPQSAYLTSGQGQINMFRVDTAEAGVGDAPTWNSIGPVTGSLVGTFELPTVGSDEPVLLYLNQLVCQKELVLRFGITRYSSEKGSVAYMNAGGMGLRERNGC
ncbi:MAG: hypothetical protein Q9161_002857 [Pseudevernia consocians]